MIVRPATEADLETLAQLHNLAFTPGWDAEEIADLGSGPGGFALIAEDPDPSGMILWRTAVGEAEIYTIAVDPAVRQRGVGRALVEAAMTQARRDGADKVFLEVSVENIGALALYGSTGFSRVGLRRGYYTTGHETPIDAVIMRRDLNT